MKIKLDNYIITRKEFTDGSNIYCLSVDGYDYYHKYLCDVSKQIAEELGYTNDMFIAGFKVAIEKIWLANAS